jgi:hypothetical protein
MPASMRHTEGGGKSAMMSLEPLVFTTTWTAIRHWNPGSLETTGVWN